MNRITQEAQARQRFLEYFLKNGHATETAIRYRISRKTLYKWLKRYDGTWQSLVEQSRQDRYFKSSDLFWFFTETWGIDRKRVDKRSMKDF